LVQGGFTESAAGVEQVIDELQQLPLPAHEFGTRLPATARVLGHSTQGWQVLRRWREVLGFSLSAKREDRAFVQGVVLAVAGGLATLSAEGVEGSRQEGFASEANFQQLRQQLLRPEELGAQSTEALVHGNSQGAPVGQ